MNLIHNIFWQYYIINGIKRKFHWFDPNYQISDTLEIEFFLLHIYEIWKLTTNLTYINIINFWQNDLSVLYYITAEVIDISSDDDDDDDDAVQITKDEDSEVDPEDPNNGGNHINDDLNVADLEGRVQVNIGHPPEDDDIYLHPQIAKVIKAHQVSVWG